MTLQTHVTVEVDDFDVFFAPLLKEIDGEVSGALRSDSDGDLVTYIAEAKVGLNLIAPYLNKTTRILEIGSGVGALSAFLKSKGYNIKAIEPIGEGFAHMAALQSRLLGCMQDAGDFEIEDKSCDQLSRAQDGEFDLIFSVNVLEHIDDLDGALSSMTDVLKADGVMVHLCPNYRIPYEPHFGIPILLWSSGLTARVFRSQINARRALWNSLNFVTSGRIRRISQRLNLTIRFEDGVMADTVRRLRTDPVFEARHAQGIGKFSTLASSRVAEAVLERWPATWATPMKFTMRKKSP